MSFAFFYSSLLQSSQWIFLGMRKVEEWCRKPDSVFIQCPPTFSGQFFCPPCKLGSEVEVTKYRINCNFICSVYLSFFCSLLHFVLAKSVEEVSVFSTESVNAKNVRYFPPCGLLGHVSCLPQLRSHLQDDWRYMRGIVQLFSTKKLLSSTRAQKK